MIVRALALLGVAAVASGEPSSFGTARLGFLTRAREPKRKLGASASLDWTTSRRC